MIDIAFYLVTKEVAERSGLQDERYVAKDGRFIFDNKDLTRIQLTSQEYITGLDGIELITEKEAKRLIAENNYQLGEEVLDNNNENEE